MSEAEYGHNLPYYNLPTDIVYAPSALRQSAAELLLNWSFKENGVQLNENNHQHFNFAKVLASLSKAMQNIPRNTTDEPNQQSNTTGEPKQQNIMTDEQINALNFCKSFKEYNDKIGSSDSLKFDFPIGLCVHSINKRYFKKKLLSPDFIVFNRDYVEHELGMMFVIELTMKEDDVDVSHITKVARYNENILASQGKRKHIVSIVTNLKYVVFVETLLDSDNTFKSSRTEPHVFVTQEQSDSRIKDGLDYLCSFLQNNRHYSYRAVPFQCPLKDFDVDASQGQMKIENYVGKGATSYVYQAKLGQREYAVKIFDDENAFNTEKRILEEIKSLTSSDDIDLFCRVKSTGCSGSKSALIMEPYGSRRASRREYFTSENMARLFRALNALEKCKKVHRDIAPQHILLDDYNRVFLIDFGFAVDVGKQVTYAGRRHYAAKEILKELSESSHQTIYTPKFAHDWESFLKTMLIIFLPDLCVDLHSYENYADILKFWEDFEKDSDDALKMLFDSVRKDDLVSFEKKFQIWTSSCKLILLDLIISSIKFLNDFNINQILIVHHFIIFSSY
jgi:predicted Ser/Thr protein kinase